MIEQPRRSRGDGWINKSLDFNFIYVEPFKNSSQNALQRHKTKKYQVYCWNPVVFSTQTTLFSMFLCLKLPKPL